ncbi:glycosyltransferase, partial [Hyella patelloides]
KNGLPVIFHIVSKMKYGSKVYTDHPNAFRYQEDLELINLNNVVFHKQIKNQEVLTLLSKSHFQIMPTLHDTYGFSIIEGFSVATPAITTNVCALPEIVRPDQNGYLLELEVNQNQNWTKKSFQRGSQEHWDILDSTYNNLADQALKFLQEFLKTPEHYERLSAGAIAQAYNVHDSQKNRELLDNLYSAIAQG